jgi:hypothetical protein
MTFWKSALRVGSRVAMAPCSTSPVDPSIEMTSSRV